MPTLANCPNCTTIVPITASECPRCRAVFGGDSKWQLVPNGKSSGANEPIRDDPLALDSRGNIVCANCNQSVENTSVTCCSKCINVWTSNDLDMKLKDKAKHNRSRNSDRTLGLQVVLIVNLVIGGILISFVAGFVADIVRGRITWSTPEMGEIILLLAIIAYIASIVGIFMWQKWALIMYLGVVGLGSGYLTILLISESKFHELLIFIPIYATYTQLRANWNMFK